MQEISLRSVNTTRFDWIGIVDSPKLALKEWALVCAALADGKQTVGSNHPFSNLNHAVWFTNS